MRVIALSMLTVSYLALGGCGQGEAPISNDRLLQAFEDGRTGIWVSAQAPVVQSLGDEMIRGKTHQKFSIRPAENVTVQIRHSVEDAERVPVEPGDRIRVHGYYEWDARGGFIWRTFKDPDEPGGGGWVEHKGRRYD